MSSQFGLFVLKLLVARLHVSQLSGHRDRRLVQEDEFRAVAPARQPGAVARRQPKVVLEEKYRVYVIFEPDVVLSTNSANVDRKYRWQM